MRPMLPFMIVLVLLNAATLTRTQADTTSEARSRAASLRFERLGNPVADKKEQARYVNDLKLFAGRLYIGHGHYGYNTGPTDVLYYDLDRQGFVTEFTIDDHSIERFNFLGGQLAIPGSDATEGWTFGNIYLRGEGGWTKHRTLPDAVHVFDLAEWRGVWFAATGEVIPLGADEQISPGAIFASTDRGQTWQADFTTPSFSNGVVRVQRLIHFNNKLYAFLYAYASVPLEAVPEEAVSGVERQRMGSAEILYINDPVGTTDAWVRGKRWWEPINLIDLPNVAYVDPHVFRDQLVLDVKGGPYYPVKPRVNFRREDLPDRLEHLLMVSDGQTARRLPIQVQHIADVLPKEDRLFVLMIKDRQFQVAETRDLEQWTLHPIPVSEGIARQIEFDGRWLYVAFAGGDIRRARLSPAATPPQPAKDAPAATVHVPAQFDARHHGKPEPKR